jgi:hypothetical protein
MADAQHVQQDADGPPYPTFSERRYENGKAPIFSGAYERLIWPIRGEFPSAIAVMPVPHRNTGTPEPFFNPETGEWHAIASQSITNTKVSSLEASLSNLDSWDRTWERKHMEHADPAYDECEFVTYGDLNNDVRPFAEEPERQDGTWSWETQRSWSGAAVRIARWVKKALRSKSALHLGTISLRLKTTSAVSASLSVYVLHCTGEIDL